MTQYCTKQGLIDRFGEGELIELTDRESFGDINDDVLNRAIKDASVEMDAYLSRFNFTADNLPQVLSPIACNIARYYLYDNAPTEHVTRRYEDAIKFLKSVNKGEITIGNTEAGTPVPTQELPEIQSGGSVFSRKNSQGYI
ncbi:hypothetical protein tloyanaT_26240 [Thalassotalea loyana]|uniref:DUF1320 domain-containing protein n=1 Tax=Thalassotalea loyana TaxID=280483 RepID=A0ABQ6HHJ6_9GAMM|nr:DUF1320 domain-containing protein [Thalassotalea loyana]GLX86371.1 hypothetical protein tloyanaT_26240 [Thalassotalea loyana]